MVWTYTEDVGVSLPEPNEELTSATSQCFGWSKHVQPSCKHKPDTVIALDSINVGSKLNSTGCPPEGGHDQTCCRPVQDDCIFPYRYKDYNR